MEHPRVRLPQLQDNQFREERSYRALRDLLEGSGLFLVRRTPPPDYGVDAYIELVRDGHPTNLTAICQLKGSDSPTDSRVVRLKVSTLNYLLAGPSPLVFKWHGPTQKICYCWVLDELARLDQTKQWRDQRVVTLRLENDLTSATLTELYNKLHDEADVRVRLSHELPRQVDDVTRIELTSIGTMVSGSTEAYEALRKHGLVLLHQGDVDAITRLTQTLGKHQQDDPYILMIVGYMMMTQGRWALALGSLNQSLIRASDLSEEEADFVRHLRSTAMLRLGISPYSSENQKEPASETTVPKLFAKVELIRMRLLQSDVPIDELKGHLHRLQGLCAEMRSCPDSNIVAETQLETYAIEVEFEVLFASVIEALWDSNVFEEASVDAGLASLQLALAPLDDRLSILMQEVANVGHKRSVARCSLAKAYMRSLLIGYLEELYLRLGRRIVATSAVPDAVSLAEQGFRLSHECGDVEGQMRAMGMKMRVWEAIGQIDEARSIAAEILKLAEIHQFPSHGRMAEDVWHQRSRLARIRASKFQTGDAIGS